MAGIRSPDNARPPRGPRAPESISGGNVHYLFQVRNMFSPRAPGNGPFPRCSALFSAKGPIPAADIVLRARGGVGRRGLNGRNSYARAWESAKLAPLIDINR